MIHVILPAHLRTLAKIQGEVYVDVTEPVTVVRILEALEVRYPVLDGAIREHVSRQRRPLLRFFACGQDVSHADPDQPLPAAIATGHESFWIVGAVAGG